MYRDFSIYRDIGLCFLSISVFLSTSIVFPNRKKVSVVYILLIQVLDSGEYRFTRLINYLLTLSSIMHIKRSKNV